MKTTAQIDILKVTHKKDGTYIVEYWDEAHDGENNVTMQISEESLLTMIDEEGMNKFNMPLFDDYQTESVDPKDYLKENLDEVILDYITANS